LIDYERMRKVHPKQKAALTRAVKSKDRAKIEATVRAAITEWNEIGCWPDDWARWNIAFNDARPYWDYKDIQEL
jgi:hypothetical protein